MKQPWQCLRSRLGRDPNPLRRAVDRAEASTLLGLVTSFVLVWILVSVFVGQLAYSAGVRQEQAEQGWRQVTATLSESAAQAAASSPVYGAVFVPATWQLPGRPQQAGQIATELNAKAGQQIRIWVNAFGTPTRPPLTVGGIIDQVVFAVLSATVVLAALLALAAGSVRLLFNRRRMAGWQRDWDAVGPLWSRR